MLSRFRFCCYMPNALLLRECGLHILPTVLFTILAYINYFVSENCIGLHSVVDILVDFEHMYPGFESRESHEFFFITFLYSFFYVFFCHYYYSANLQIQHYCFYSDSPTLLPFMMPKPPAPSAL